MTAAPSRIIRTMSTPSGPARRASAPGGIVAWLGLLASVVALGACAGSGSGASSTGSSRVTTTTSTRSSAATAAKPPNFAALPPATIPAGGCTPAPAAPGATVTMTVNDTGFSPHCITLTTTQTLRLRNAGRLFHNVVVEDLDSNLAPGGSQVWDELGQYLAPGRYVLYSGTERNQALYPTFHSTLVVQDGS
jgi:hypothetical protein